MDRILYVAMAGARQTEVAMAANAHNLANVSTPGFRADLAAIRAMPLPGQGFSTRVFARAENAGVDLSNGPVSASGRELDVAVQGDGWIAVEGRDGSEGYTRRGDLHVNADGILETGDGHAVLGNSGPIAVPPAEKIEIAADGTISIRPLGADAAALAVVDRIRLVQPDPGKLIKRADGLLHLDNESSSAPDAQVQLSVGALELSNVNAVEALVNMIALSRAFENQVRQMRGAQENDAVSAEIMRMY